MDTLLTLHDEIMTDLFETACTLRGTGPRLSPIVDPQGLKKVRGEAQRVLTSLLGHVVCQGHDVGYNLELTSALANGIDELTVYRRLN